MTSGLIEGLVWGLTWGLIWGLISGLRTEIKTRAKPNQGIWESAKNSIILTLITCPIWMLFLVMRWQIQGLNFKLIDLLTSALAVGLIFGISFGGFPVIQHFILRLILCQSGAIPWNYARFLDYCTERRFLQRIGGRYRFIHDLLRENFANQQDYFINR